MMHLVAPFHRATFGVHLDFEDAIFPFELKEFLEVVSIFFEFWDSVILVDSHNFSSGELVILSGFRKAAAR